MASFDRVYEEVSRRVGKENLLSQKDIARGLRVSARTVLRWRKKAGFPKAGGYIGASPVWLLEDIVWWVVGKE